MEISLLAAALSLTIGALTIGPLGRAEHITYYPHVSGKPAGALSGVIVGYGQGMASGTLSVRSDAGRIVQLYLAALPFTVNGNAINCAIGPRGTARYSRTLACQTWDTRVVLGRTHVIVPYWTGRRYGVNTVIAKGLTTIPSTR